LRQHAAARRSMPHKAALTYFSTLFAFHGKIRADHGKMFRFDYKKFYFSRFFDKGIPQNIVNFRHIKIESV